MTTNSRTVAELQIALEAIMGELRAVEWDTAPDTGLVPLALSLKATSDYAKLVHGQIELRAVTNGTPVPGAAVKDAIVHRKWHDEQAAAELAREEFGDDAFTVSLLSPAGIEKLGTKGKNFVAVASYKPEAGKRVVY